MKRRDSVKLSGLSACLALVLSGCGDEGVFCTLIGCHSGLTVAVASPPATPFRVEAYVFGSGPRFAETCSATPCVVFFPDFTPAGVRVDVIAGPDTTTREFTPVYVVSRPNGPACDPECRIGAVTFLP